MPRCGPPTSPPASADDEQLLLRSPKSAQEGKPKAAFRSPTKEGREFGSSDCTDPVEPMGIPGRVVPRPGGNRMAHLRSEGSENWFTSLPQIGPRRVRRRIRIRGVHGKARDGAKSWADSLTQMRHTNPKQAPIRLRPCPPARYTAKYLAWGWCATMAEVVCSGTISIPSVSSTPIFPGSSMANTGMCASRSGQDG